MKTTLLSIGSDAKTVKGEGYGYRTAILYLAPAMESGHEVCPSRSEGCTKGCLFTSGHGAYQKVKTARINRTLALFNDRNGFIANIISDIDALVKNCNKNDMIPAVRLNGTSDLGWEGIAKELFAQFSDIHFYDYTKVKSRMIRYVEGKLPSNYSLTFSRSENNWDDCLEILSLGGNVAVVFDKVPESYAGYEVVNGDLSDLRFLDKKGVIVGLKAKGKARKDDSGFVIKVGDKVKVGA